MDIDGNSPEHTIMSLPDLIAAIDVVLNPEIRKNYENIINWLLGINTLAVFFMLSNYDKNIKPDDVVLIIVPYIGSVGLISFPHIFLVIGMILLMFSIVALFLLRLITFNLIHQRLLDLPSLEPIYKNVGDPRNFTVLANKLESVTIYLNNITKLIRHIYWPTLSTGAGLIFIFIYYLFTISYFAVGFFAFICILFMIKLFQCNKLDLES